jgi:hypothetical protein
MTQRGDRGMGFGMMNGSGRMNGSTVPCSRTGVPVGFGLQYGNGWQQPNP